MLKPRVSSDIPEGLGSSSMELGPRQDFKTFLNIQFPKDTTTASDTVNFSGIRMVNSLKRNWAKHFSSCVL